ncbi:CheR family methyltransferase [Aerolutibacter ruishenii]|uniref:Chemotaxis protein methyltransferase n=1 Tax=Aerolutibacter ruishenii TaxID=686800 RepID=A0A562LK34_9GAMM|nr:CheR family methyltransferase [Lysobacter ruishenii]TWI07994.1 chemotaxis protein methyltransferase CheR [Lysobacter ruishenii]
MAAGPRALHRETRQAPTTGPGGGSAHAPSGDREFAFTERDFQRACRLIHEHAGISLGTHKRDMVYSRLARRIRSTGTASFADYLDHVERGDHDDVQAFVNALTTNLTSFFRESHHFDMLGEQLRAAPRRTHELWCCAASTGEEPYSIAITACEAFGTLAPPVRILATDIDTNVLNTAARGVYPIERAEAVPPALRHRYFQRGTGPNAGLCRVLPALQALIEFRPLNLLAPHYGLAGGFSAVFCRNVMIYFDKPTQLQVLSRIVPLLESDGVLYAGHSESFTHAADLVRPAGRTSYRAAKPKRAERTA